MYESWNLHQTLSPGDALFGLAVMLAVIGVILLLVPKGKK